MLRGGAKDEHFSCFLSSCQLGLIQLADEGQKMSKVNYGVLNSSKKQQKLTILSREDAQDSEFRSSFGRNEETKNCFRDSPTSNDSKKIQIF